MNINEIELACNLADKSVIDELLYADMKYLNEEDLFEIRHENDEEVQYYKSEVQEVFNRWYDYYLNEILKCQE